ncbi:MAG: serine/threonine protein kinase [Ramlibacter sp.]|nr:serine/threonine protein kinase [Ramlibacter sp.]
MANQDHSKNDSPQDRASDKEGSRKIGLLSADQPDLVAPSGANEGDHGAADDKPMAGGAINLDDDELTHPRGNTSASGGTWQAQGGDSGKIGAPAEILSDRNGPSDSSSKKN